MVFDWSNVTFIHEIFFSIVDTLQFILFTFGSQSTALSVQLQQITLIAAFDQFDFVETKPGLERPITEGND